jgi:hypothetical protein
MDRGWQIHLASAEVKGIETMNQTLSKALLLSGGTWFLYQLAEFLAKHSSWADFSTPAGIGEIVQLAAGAIVTVLGALGVELPRNPGPDKIAPRRVIALFIALSAAAAEALR